MRVSVGQQFFEGLLDPACKADLSRGQSQQMFGKLGFLFFPEMASAPYAILTFLYRSWPGSVVPEYHVMHDRNRNLRMDSDLRGRPGVNQHVPDHKPFALPSSSRLRQPY
jgi:hypothetical protein